MHDPASDAYHHLVEELLGSEQFGERFASMWLNVARFALDQAHQVGKDNKFFYPHAHRYRAWVIDAFNRDLPYDEFVRLQLAADFYGEADLQALGFLGLGPQYYNRKRLDVMADEWEDRVDTVTRGFLALTVACARCHDHKYDPVEMADYYALAGVFASTDMHTRKIGDIEIHAVKDGKVQNLPIFNRGNVDDKGAEVPRRFVRVLCGEAETPAVFTQGSGRRELAEAIATAQNPLTARVIVNRLWGEIFGTPLVTTPSNFGEFGSRPSHPELLDFLAVKFVEDGWSMKQLVRQMVLSATYRQGTSADPVKLGADPGNLLLSRMNRRRLSAEMLRDSMLLFSGELDPTGGKSMKIEDPKNLRRTVYAHISRLELDGFLMQFDYPDANVHAAKRARTTTPTQKLFLLNSPFVLGRCEEIADGLADAQADAGIDQLYMRFVSRPPSAQERALSRAFLDAGDQPDKTRWAQLAQVLLCSNAFQYRD